MYFVLFHFRFLNLDIEITVFSRILPVCVSSFFKWGGIETYCTQKLWHCSQNDTTDNSITFSISMMLRMYCHEYFALCILCCISQMWSCVVDICPTCFVSFWNEQFKGTKIFHGLWRIYFVKSRTVQWFLDSDSISQIQSNIMNILIIFPAVMGLYIMITPLPQAILSVSTITQLLYAMYGKMPWEMMKWRSVHSSWQCTPPHCLLCPVVHGKKQYCCSPLPPYSLDFTLWLLISKDKI
jgi:hypothetical protein